MIPNFVDGLDIKVIDQEIHDNDNINIDFEANGFTYGLWITRNHMNGKFYPDDIEHWTNKEKDCPFCGHNPSKISVCLELMKYMDELFQRLITFNSIRMFWLFLDHEGNE